MILPAVAVNIQAHSDANIVVKLLGDKLMINTRPLNAVRQENGLIFNWGKTSNFDEKGECLINFDYAYSCNVQINAEPQDKCLVFDIIRTGFKLRRKSKGVKEIKWFAIGY